ncbi:aminotransferase class V-fold PLP-dependent enzyme [Novosphingobium terrae]|uniref:aminotransferase class V-fold PLP-dependent enzyme n=1 Tax=Novosphingobium terrae TaxID=2726189 RepID=UPI00198185F3|nr:aminotransferase class V-fold PLP-dependent enzyme [Novosphingobium terrae]
MTNRREFLMQTGAIGMAAISRPALSQPGAAETTSTDWAAMEREMDALYTVDRRIVNFDAAYYGAMTHPVEAAYREKIAWVNRYNSTFLRDMVPGASRDIELGKSRDAVAKLIGAKPDEIALAGGGTEALYALIANYRPIKPGDAVIYADVDYDEMQYAMDYLGESRGAKVVRFSIPEPHTRANILAAYEKVLKDTPRAKLLLVTHVSNRNGLIPPVAKIVAMAKARGVDVILDSAQAVGLMPFDVTAIGADFIGFSLHKWIGAPLGVGGIYIRKERQADIGRWLGNRIYAEDDIRARIPSGTVDFAARLTIPAAIDVLDQIGIERKYGFLKHLRNRWADGVRDVPGLSLMLPDEPGNYGAISAFRLPGMKTIEQAKQAQARFVQKHGVLVVAKAGLAAGPGLRVTPALFNTAAELDQLIAAIHAEKAMFA